MQIEQQMKSLKAQSEQQIYSRIMDARLKIESTETFTKMAEESPIFAERIHCIKLYALMWTFYFIIGLHCSEIHFLQ